MTLAGDCQDGVTVRSQGQGINKRVSRSCQEGVKRARQGAKRVSRGCPSHEGVKNVLGENQEGAKNMLRRPECQEGLTLPPPPARPRPGIQQYVMKVTRDCEEFAKGVSRGSQEGDKKISRELTEGAQCQLEEVVKTHDVGSVTPGHVAMVTVSSLRGCQEVTRTLCSAHE